MTILVIISLPLLLAAAVLFPRLRPMAVALAPWSALPVLGLAFWSPSHFAVELPWLLLGTRLGLDEVGRIVLIGTSLLWTLAGVSARVSLSQDPRHHRFFFAYLVTMTGILGLFIVQDLPTFTVFYALMTFAAYGLILYEDNPAAQRAGRIYLIFAVIGEALLVEAVLLITAAAGSQEITGVPHAVAVAPTRSLIITLLLAGFGIKIGVLPFHVWIPLAYSSAPTGASAVLSGSMVMAGFLGCIRLLPLGEISLPAWGIFCITSGTIALLYGVSVGLSQKNPRTILAYSSISQVGLMTTGLGIGMMLPEGRPLTLGMLAPYALHHALVMGALFLGLGVAQMVSATVWQGRMVGIGFFVAALTLAGAPLTSGAVLKGMFHSTAAMTLWAEQVSWLLPIAAIGITVLMGRFLREAWPPAQSRGIPHGARLTTGIWLPWAILLLCGGMSSYVVPWNPLFEPSALLWSPIAVWGSLWPLLMGGLLVWGLERKPGRCGGLPIPPGDLVVCIEWLVHRTQERWHVIPRMVLKRWPSDLVSRWFPQKSGLWISSIIEEVEGRLGQWMVLGAAFLFLAALFFSFLITAT